MGHRDHDLASGARSQNTSRRPGESTGGLVRKDGHGRYEPPNLAATLLYVVDAQSRSRRPIKASMTAYSTAVGPSSETVKRWVLLANWIMVRLHLKRDRWP